MDWKQLTHTLWCEYATGLRQSEEEYTCLKRLLMEGS